MGIVPTGGAFEVSTKYDTDQVVGVDGHCYSMFSLTQTRMVGHLTALANFLVCICVWS